VIEDQPLDELVPYIDWTFFFTAWELRGKFPAIFEHPKYGAPARELYADGKKKLDELVKGKLIRASAVYGFWPAASDGNDIVLYTDESRGHELLRFPMLRQQGGDGALPLPGRLRGPARRACPTTWAPSPSPRASASTSWP
jgi:5-methyltetrahydrofolate--homocysteine methyltransferase